MLDSQMVFVYSDVPVMRSFALEMLFLIIFFVLHLFSHIFSVENKRFNARSSFEEPNRRRTKVSKWIDHRSTELSIDSQCAEKCSFRFAHKSSHFGRTQSRWCEYRSIRDFINNLHTKNLFQFNEWCSLFVRKCESDERYALRSL